MKMTLSAIKKGRIDKPKRVLLYGCEGVGKTTFAAGAPSPVFIGAEDGTNHLDVARFPEPESWADILGAIKELHGQHSFKTVVIDTLDWVEPLCWQHVCQEGGQPTIEAFGYGKGYVAALDQWRVLLSALDRLRGSKGMHVALLAHSHIRTYRNPKGEDYDRFELKLNPKASALCKEWADAVLFANYDLLTHTEENRTRGVSSGARFIHTSWHAAYDAKNRFSLPDRLPLGWADLESSVGSPGKVEDLVASIDELVPKLSKELAEKLATHRKRAGRDPVKLAKTLDWANAKLETETT